MATESPVTQEHAPHQATAVDAEKLRRVLSVREPAKAHDKSAAQPAAAPKPSAR